MAALPSPRTIIAANLAKVREQIAAAADRVHRDPTDIKLVGVSKYVDVATARLLVEAGCNDLGESRPQELWQKTAAPELAGVHWHLVGRLQRNKVRRTLPLVELVHSVDSERLLEAIDEHAGVLELPPRRVLLEVNCSADTAKQGFSPEEVRRLLPTLGAYQRVQVEGLMTMAALEGGEAVARQNFAALRELRHDFDRQRPPNVSLRELSMGMSGDFEAAIAEGATIVRIGSSLFEGLPD